MGAEIGGNFGRRLNTWKEIASFFGRDERTVKRWEVSRALPVRRLPNGTRSTVYAYEYELTAWLNEGGTSDIAVEPAGGNVSAVGLEGWKKRAYRVIAAACGIMLACMAILGADTTLPARATMSAKIASPRHLPNAEASAFYRTGLYEWQTRTPVGLTRAVDDFTQAIVHDPLYAEAYVGLANCYNLLREFSTMPPEEAFPHAKAAAERAIALDPSLGNAHAALAFVDFYWSRDITGARREFERALALEPRNATAHHWYATFLMAIGEYPRALTEIDKAQLLDSESTAILADKGLILVASGKQNEGVALLQRLEQTEPAFYSSHRYLASIYLDQGNDAGFLRELAAAASARHDEGDAAIADAGAKGQMAAGRVGMLQAMLDVQKNLYAEGKQSAYSLAATYARLNDADNAIAYLKLSLTRHETDNVILANDSAFGRLRSTPQLRGLMRDSGSPPPS